MMNAAKDKWWTNTVRDDLTPDTELCVASHKVHLQGVVTLRDAQADLYVPVQVTGLQAVGL